jgi:hypothetical protein
MGLINFRKYKLTSSKIFDKESLPKPMVKLNGLDNSQRPFSVLNKKQRNEFLMHPKYAWT